VIPLPTENNPWTGKKGESESSGYDLYSLNENCFSRRGRRRKRRRPLSYNAMHGKCTERTKFPEARMDGESTKQEKRVPGWFLESGTNNDFTARAGAPSGRNNMEKRVGVCPMPK